MRTAPLLLSGCLLALLFGSLACRDEKQAGDDDRSPARDAAEQNRGRELYERHGCAGCHGARGHGDGPVAAGLAERPKDFREPGAFTRGGSADEIGRTLRTGIPGSSMIGYDHLPEVDRLLLARYVVFLGKQK